MLRVGTVPYLVARPVDLGLEDEPEIELVKRVPAELVEGLRAGELDVALVSSIELFRREGYRYLDGPAVVASGRVSSVEVFLRRPVEDVRSVALDPASRASAALIQCVWPAAERPRFLEVEAGLDPRDVEADAWLRIGDAALRESLAPDAPPTFNPSEAWAAATGLPFVFAAWIVRPGVEVEPWAPAFARARARGVARVDELAREAAAAWDLPVEPARRYLGEEMLHDPGLRLEPSLFAFRDRAAALGLCRGDVTPAAVEVPTHA